MTPTPIVATPRSLADLWWLLGLIGIVLLLLIIGLLTGEVDLSGKRVRQARNRALLTTQSLFEADKRDAIVYVLEEQDQVVMEQDIGSDNGPDEQTDDLD